MTSSAAPQPYHDGPTDRAGVFRYLKPSVPRSLFRNGQVLTRRDTDGSDTETIGVETHDVSMLVRDARALTGSDRRTLERNGFELFHHPTADPSLDFLQHESVLHHYYAECEAIIKSTTGAARVVAFDHNVRSASGKSTQQRIDGGQQVQGPAQMVHGDYTLTSAPQRLRDLSRIPTRNDTFRTLLDPGKTLLESEEVELALSEGHRYAIINLWRNIAAEAVANHPLALCDAQSVAPEDLVVFEIHYKDRIGENYFAKQAPLHDWYFYPAMTRDEALLIKQWDSMGPLARSQGQRGDAEEPTTCTFSFHTSFTDDLTPGNAPQRWSIEVRCAVMY